MEPRAHESIHKILNVCQELIDAQDTSETSWALKSLILAVHNTVGVMLDPGNAPWWHEYEERSEADGWRDILEDYRWNMVMYMPEMLNAFGGDNVLDKGYRETVDRHPEVPVHVKESLRMLHEKVKQWIDLN